MQKEKEITLGHYTKTKLLELLPYGLANATMPRVPVFGLASEHTPDEILAMGCLPTSELIDYWKGTTWNKAENKEGWKEK